MRISREVFEDWIREGLPVHRMPDGTLRITETQADHFFNRRAGIEPRAEAQPCDAEYLSIAQAAEVTNLSETHIRRAIRSGALLASNVGSPARPLWRIARKD